MIANEASYSLKCRTCWIHFDSPQEYFSLKIRSLGTILS